MGAVLASFCVEQQGTQEHRLEVPEFWGRYAENFGGGAGGRPGDCNQRGEAVDKAPLM